MSRTDALRRLTSAAAAITVVVATGIGLAPASSAAAATPGRAAAYQVIGAAVRLPSGDRVTGLVPSQEMVRADVVLEPRSSSLLTEYATAVSTPRSPLYRHFESPAAFRAEFAPSKAVRAAVVTVLRGEGLEVLPAAADGLVIPVEATAARMQTAFRTTLESVRLASGRAGQWATSPPELPASVAGRVLAVLGLDELVTPEPTLAPDRAARRLPAAGGSGATPSRASAATSGPKACKIASLDATENSAFTDDQVAHAYGLDGLYSKGILGAHETVALFEEDTYLTSDLRAFDKCYFGSSHTDQVKLINVDGGEPAGVGEGEAALDVEDVSAYAPGADIDVYDAPGDLIGWVDEMAAIVNQDLANVINVSYGLCETQMEEAAPGLVQTENVLFEEGALQGQTFVVSSGDSGSETCFRNDSTNTSLSVSDPASQPFAVSVGGTSLKSATFPPDETVWNDGGSGAVGSFGQNGGGGGGISQVWPMPAWQEAATTKGIRNHYSTGALCGAPAATDCHEVPDVSASADELHGDTIVYGGFWTTIGGTSASAPKWVALLALTDAYCASRHLPAVGFAAPALYEIASNPVSYAEAFNDVTSGNNDVLGDNDGAYPATPGYDLASGLGTPRATNENGTTGLTALLCEDGAGAATHPVLTAVTPAFGSYTGGTSVTLTGSRLKGVTEAQFGPASVKVSASDINAAGTSITLDTPPSPTQPFDGSTPVGGVAVAVSGPKGTSDTSTSVQFHYVAGSSSSPKPSVFYLTPSSANPGTVVTIHGSGFLEGGTPSVHFGSTVASGVTVVSDTVLTAIVPAEPPSTSCVTADEGVPLSSLCQVEVTVTNTFGTSATQTILPPPTGFILDLFIPAPETENVPAVTEFDYAPAPVLTSVSPDSVGLAPSFLDPFSPQILTITGTGFNYFTLSAVLAKVPGRPALDQSLFVGVITPTSVEVEVPAFGPTIGPPPPKPGPHASGPPTSFQLTVVSGGQTSNALTVGVASSAITVTSISRHSGSTSGGSTVTVTGHDLTAATGILYVSTGPLGAEGTTTELTVLSSTKLTFVTPAMVPGPGFFSVCDASVCSGSPPQTSFTYYEPVQPVVTGISPSSGSAGGGETATIAGSGLGGVTAVRFGNFVTTDVTNPLIGFGTSTTAVQAVVPPGAIGKRVRITVVTLAGTSKPASVFFTYTKGAPGPPSDVKVKPAAGALVVSWKPPVNDGGSPVTGYVVSAHAVNENPFVPPVTFTPLAVEPPTARSVVLPVSPHVIWTAEVTAKTSLGSRAADVKEPFVVRPGDDGYAVAAADGTVLGYGDLGGLPPGNGGTRKASPIVGVAVTPLDNGYWTVAANGQVRNFGQAKFHGSLKRADRKSPAVAVVADSSGLGYWVVTAAGGVFAFGDAGKYGHLEHSPSSPIVAAAATSGGYWLVSSSGRVFAFGAAKKSGDLVAKHVGAAAVAIVANPVGPGYWIVTANGGVYAFGGARRLEGLKKAPASTVVGAAVGPDGKGGWLLEADGSVVAIGKARLEGSPVSRLESAATAISV